MVNFLERLQLADRAKLSAKASARVRGSLAAVIAALLLLAAAPPATGSYHPALDEKDFPVPAVLLPAVEFWRDIFARYSSDQTVLHDDWYLDIVYGVVDGSDLAESHSAVAAERLMDRRVRKATESYSAILHHLAGDRGATGLDPDEIERVRLLFANVDGGKSKYRTAVSRLRGQRGLKDRFEEAIEISGMFMPGIERILAEAGVPEVVKCMPFVESMFNYKARSKVGASGAWQFTRSTGQLFLQIDAAVDARSDVLLAARGAAKLLRENYRRVESWPLALTGYNHGIAGMQRAVRRLGTKDIGEIVGRYRSRTFGFASRNFYAEFVAAVSVYYDRETLFPGVEPRDELRFDEFVPTTFVSLQDLAQLTGADIEELEELNPALHQEVIAGRLLIPSSYPLRVPPGQVAVFSDAYDRLPASRKPSRQLATRYRVARGDTLGRIARHHGTSVAALQRANALPRADRIYVGQILEIPNSGRDWGPLVLADTESAIEGEHVVRPGETLARIAARYGVSVASLVASNGLSSPDLLQVGQVLRLGSGSEAVPSEPASRSHRVRRGDTLSRIAALYGTTVRALMTRNGLTNSLIQVGQILQIP